MSKPEIDLLAVVCDGVEQPDDVGEDGHCYHHSHDQDCDYGADCDDDSDDCVHCNCCCTCLGCEYGPQDGMLMYPNGAPWAAEAVVKGE